MHADIQGALNQLNKYYNVFEHNGQRLTKNQVKKILEYGISKGYKCTSEFSDDEVDKIINNDRVKEETIKKEIIKKEEIEKKIDFYKKNI
jgi:hypothetical protein